MANTENPPQPFKSRYPVIPISSESLVNAALTNEELGVLVRATALVWREEWPDDIKDQAKILQIDAAEWDGKLYRVLWSAFKISVEGWKKHSLNKTEKMSKAAIAREEKKRALEEKKTAEEIKAWRDSVEAK